MQCICGCGEYGGADQRRLESRTPSCILDAVAPAALRAALTNQAACHAADQQLHMAGCTSRRTWELVPLLLIIRAEETGCVVTL
jgi:hypothetical protein